MTKIKLLVQFHNALDLGGVEGVNYGLPLGDLELGPTFGESSCDLWGIREVFVLPKPIDCPALSVFPDVVIGELTRRLQKRTEKGKDFPAWRRCHLFFERINQRFSDSGLRLCLPTRRRGLSRKVSGFNTKPKWNSFYFSLSMGNIKLLFIFSNKDQKRKIVFFI